MLAFATGAAASPDGVVLAGIGLYAVISFAVARRTREIGIRLALGARSPQVVWSIARGVAGLIGVGTGAGLVLSVQAMLVLRLSSTLLPCSVLRASWRSWVSPPRSCRRGGRRA